MAHFAMRGRVVVDDQATFQTWIAGQPTFAATRAEVAGNATAGAALYAVCSSCHGAQAEGNPALNAPKLSGQADWYLVRQLKNFRQGIRGAGAKEVYAQQMAPFAATLPDDAAIRDVVAYIRTLPDTRAPATVSGNPAKGKWLYATCESCHGARGEGVWSTNAPRLAGMSDWYLKRQLQNFKHDVRGAHAQDFSGAQMAALSRALADDQAIDDVLGHIHSF
jgi:cytochrome c oxidase subunit 2